MITIREKYLKPNTSAFDNLDVYELAMLLCETRLAIKRATENFDEISPNISAIKKVVNEFDDIDEKLSVLNQKMDKECRYILDALIDVEDYAEIEFENEKEVPCYVYYILNEEKDKVKIGISNDPITRAKNLQTASGEDIEILHAIKFKNREEALEAEKCLHTEFSDCRKRPSKIAKSCEWFDARIIKILMKDYTTREAILKLRSLRLKELVEAMCEVSQTL